MTHKMEARHPAEGGKITVAVVYGGRSGEHEVSLKSAASIINALDKTKYEVLPLRIEKTGQWTVDSAAMLEGTVAVPRLAAPAAADERTLAPSAAAGGALLNRDSQPAEKIDVVLPIVHGTGGEDGALQGLFDLAGIPYVGTGILGSAVGMDKVAQKKLLERDGFPVAPYVHFRAADWRVPGASEVIVNRIEADLAYPCFVKPANLGSSVGVSKAHHRIELLAGIEDALTYDTKIVVEKGVPEAREIECAVLGNHHPKASVLGEIVPSNEFYDYAAKYLDGKSVEHIPADVPQQTAENIRRMAVEAFKAMDCSGMARVDFFVEKQTGAIWLNEINTLPGFTSVSMYPKLWEASGLPYPKLLDELVSLALERDAERKALRREFAVPGQA